MSRYKEKIVLILILSLILGSVPVGVRAESLGAASGDATPSADSATVEEKTEDSDETETDRVSGNEGDEAGEYDDGDSLSEDEAELGQASWDHVRNQTGEYEPHTISSNDPGSVTAVFGSAADAEYDEASQTLTITLNEDVTLEDTLVLKQGVSGDTIEIDLNGHSITGAAGVNGTDEEKSGGQNAIEIAAAIFNVMIQGPGRITGGKGAVFEDPEKHYRYGRRGGNGIYFTCGDEEYMTDRLDHGLTVTGGAIITGGEGGDVTWDDWCHNMQESENKDAMSGLFEIYAGAGGSGISQVYRSTNNESLFALYAYEDKVYARYIIENGTVSGGNGGSFYGGDHSLTYNSLRNNEAMKAGLRKEYGSGSDPIDRFSDILNRIKHQAGDGGSGIEYYLGRKYVYVGNESIISGGDGGEIVLDEPAGLSKRVGQPNSVGGNGKGGAGILGCGDIGLTDAIPELSTESGAASYWSDKTKNSDDTGIWIDGTVRGGSSADAYYRDECGHDGGDGLSLDKDPAYYGDRDWGFDYSWGIVAVSPTGSVTGGSGGDAAWGQAGEGGSGINDDSRTNDYIIRGEIKGGDGGDSLSGMNDLDAQSDFTISLAEIGKAGGGGSGFRAGTNREGLTIAGDGKVASGDCGKTSLRPGSSAMPFYYDYYEDQYFYRPTRPVSQISEDDNTIDPGLTLAEGAIPEKTPMDPAGLSAKISMDSFTWDYPSGASEAVVTLSDDTELRSKVTLPSGYHGHVYYDWRVVFSYKSDGTPVYKQSGVKPRYECALGCTDHFTLGGSEMSAQKMIDYGSLKGNNGGFRTSIYCYVMLDDGRYVKSNEITYLNDGNGYGNTEPAPNPYPYPDIDEYGYYYTIDGVTGGRIRFSRNTGLITGCDGSVTSIVIPEKINGVSVTGIRKYAFQDKTNLKSITLGNRITTIGEGAFQRSGIEEITIPGSVKDVGRWAFMECASLRTVTIMEGVENILSSCFKGSELLESVTLPSSLKKIDNYAFQNCESLCEVTRAGAYFDPANPGDVTLGDNVFTGCALTPADFSASYNGCWYMRKLLEVGLTGNYRSDMLAIARSQLGYHEGNSYGEQDGLNDQGNKNCTEYNYWWGEPGSNWCGEFAAWCIAMASVPKEVSPRKYRTPDEDTLTWADTKWAGGSYTLRPGDVLFFSEDHIVIVESVEELEDTVLIQVINGNFHNNVSKDTFLIDASSGDILGKYAYEGHVETIFAYDMDKADEAEYQAVSFDANGGSVSCNEKRVAVGTSYGVIPYPVRSGYTFAGWFSEAEGGKQITPYSKVKSDDPVTLYAHWTEGEAPYPAEPENTGGDIRYISAGGLLWGIDQKTGIIMSAPLEFTGGDIPSRLGDIDVKGIGDYVFSGRSFTEIRIPEGVTELGNGAFIRCRLMKKVIIPSSMKKIGDYAFMNCHDLEEVVYGGKESDITFGRRVYAGTLWVRPDFSAAYKKSRYYTQLLATELTGDIRHDVLAVAASQEGYHEGNSPDEMDGGNLSGNKDFAEYNYFTHSPDWKWRPGLAENYQYGGWCGNFCDWVEAMASVPNEATQLRGDEDDDLHWEDLTYAGGGYELQPGDVLHMEVGHFCIVIESHEENGIVYIDTWNGNHSNNVCRDTYELNAADGTNTDPEYPRYRVTDIYPLYPEKYAALEKTEVTFDPHYKGCVSENKAYAYGAFFGIMPVPSWNGGTFLGWYTDPYGGYEITSYRRMHFTEDTTLFAHWDYHHGWRKDDDGEWRYYDEGIVKGAFINAGGSIYHLDDEGRRSIGRCEINGQFYYFNRKGVMQTGWISDGTGKHYYDSLNGGAMAKDTWAGEGKDRIYLDANGEKHAKGVATVSEDSVDENGDPIVVENEYYFDSNGKVKTGWIKVGDEWYYYNPSEEFYGSKITAEDDNDPDTENTREIVIGGKHYLIDEEGARLTGWQNEKYYDTNGVRTTGWKKIDGDWYYFSDTGVKTTGLAVIDGKLYSFDSDGKRAGSGQTVSVETKDANGNTTTSEIKTARSGVVKTDTEGFVQTSSGEVYLGGDGKVITDKWIETENGQIRIGSDGKRQTGKARIDGKLYLLDANGRIEKTLPTGWVSDGGKSFYYDEEGNLQTDKVVKIGRDLYGFDENGEVLSGGMYKKDTEGKYVSSDISEALYYVNPDGTLKTGWCTDNGAQYYFSDENGKKLTGVHKIGADRYYFEDNGAASEVRNDWTDDSKRYYVTEKGTLKTGWLTIGKNKYYFGKDGERKEGVVKVGTKLYYQKKDHGIITAANAAAAGDKVTAAGGNTVVKIADKTYICVNSNGVLRTGWKKFGENKYYFDKTTGLALTGTQQIKGIWYTFDNEGKLTV